MTRDEFNEFCQSLPSTTHVIQWGNSDVWKIGGKVFAIGGWHDETLGVTFKVTPLAFEVLSEGRGIRPAPYLASRGMKWLQWFEEGDLSEDGVRDHIRTSYEMIAGALSKKKQAELGLTLK